MWVILLLQFAFLGNQQNRYRTLIFQVVTSCCPTSVQRFLVTQK